MSSTSESTTRSAPRGRVGVLMGGRSAERDISLQSGTAVLDALRARAWDSVGIDIGSDPCRQIAEASLDSAFVALHGRFGEDGCIQGLLESIGLPYTGSGVLPSALAMDKVVAKQLFASAGLPTPDWCYPIDGAGLGRLGYPLVIKPRAEGSSVGLHIVHSDDELQDVLARAHNADLMAERFVAGREISVGVLGAGVRSRALGTVEIRPVSGIYDYEAKYARDDTEYLAPAPVPDALTRKLEALAVQAHRLLGCSGATRVDFRWTGEADSDPLVLELNTLPGMTGHSLLPKIAAQAGMSYEELVEAILADARLKA
jgi:D-alanine-D-alanine ligase